jgi:hypothetical protein
LLRKSHENVPKSLILDEQCHAVIIGCYFSVQFDLAAHPTLLLGKIVPQEVAAMEWAEATNPQFAGRNLAYPGPKHVFLHAARVRSGVLNMQCPRRLAVRLARSSFTVYEPRLHHPSRFVRYSTPNAVNASVVSFEDNTRLTKSLPRMTYPTYQIGEVIGKARCRPECGWNLVAGSPIT